MKARLKIFGSTLGLLVLAGVLLYGVATILVRPQLEDLEQANIQQSTTRVVEAINSVCKHLSSSTQDWSAWDDTYKFALDHNKDYIDANMSDAALKNLGLSIVIISDNKGNILYSKNIRQNAVGNMPVPSDLLTTFAGNKQLLTSSSNPKPQGFLALKSGPVFFSSAPILNSYSEGPARGTLTFIQSFDAITLKELKEQTNFPIQLYTLSSAHLPSDVAAIRQNVNNNAPISKIVSATIANGYQVLQDVDGKPALMLQVTLSRELFAQANRSLDYYLFAALFIAFLLALINGQTVGRLLHKQAIIDFKDEFFSVASHELRTPLTAIRGNSQMAIDMYGKYNIDLTEMLTDIHTASLRLIQLVNNFLDAARLDQGRLPFKPETIDAVSIIQKVVGDLQNLAKEKSLAINVHLPEHLSSVYADPERFRQVIFNLVGNAIKFTDQGSVTITAIVKEKQVIFSVTDTGRGIPKGYQKTLFKRFHQTKREDSQSGSGLGLHISKMLVVGMGGLIWLESSEKDKGTTISFSLPQGKSG